MTNLDITAVQQDQLEMLRAFAERTFRIAFEKDNDPVDFKKYCDWAFSPEQFQKEWSHPGSRFWFGWLEGALAAYLKLNFDKHPAGLESQHTVQVERLYVEPAFQGRGVGERLLDFTRGQAEIAGAEWIWLSVWQANPPAVRFYERCGFEIFGTETFWVGDDPQTDWLMHRKVR